MWTVPWLLIDLSKIMSVCTLVTPIFYCLFFFFFTFIHSRKLIRGFKHVTPIDFFYRKRVRTFNVMNAKFGKID